jgi:hypothetical protein
MDQNSQPQQPSSPTPSPLPHFANQPEVMQPAQTPKRKRKGLWAGIITAAIIVLLGAGTIAGYFLWYQNPEKVITDGLVNAIKAKTVSYTGLLSMELENDASLKIELGGKNKQNAAEIDAKATIVYAGNEIVIDGSAMVVDADLYVRFNNADQLVQDFLPAEQGTNELRDMIDTFVSKVNGQWVKITSDDMAQFSQEASDQQRCLTDMYKKIESNDAIMSEVADAYKQHKFILVAESLGTKDGSMGYRLELNEDELKNFNEAVKNTELYKQLRECDEDIDAAQNVETTANDDDTRTEVWVSQWSHEITKIRSESTAKSEAKGVFELSPKFNEVVTVEAPESFLTLEELRADVEAITEAYQRAAMENAMNGQSSELFTEEPAHHTT